MCGTVPGLILFLTTSFQAFFFVTVLFYLQQLHRVCLPSPDFCDLSTGQINTNLALVTGALTIMCKMDHTSPNHRRRGATKPISPGCLLSWLSASAFSGGHLLTCTTLGCTPYHTGFPFLPCDILELNFYWKPQSMWVSEMVLLRSSAWTV